MYQIPFHRDNDFTPQFSIPGNATSDTPVSMELFMAAGADQARVKSLLAASAGLTTGLERWTPAMQQNVVAALHNGCDLFVATVGTIRNLTAPALLCRRVQLQVPEKAADDDPIPIDTGVKFSRVAPYLPLVALEVAFEISKLTNKSHIDSRFFGSPSGSPASTKRPSGSARGARKPNAAAATAANPGQTATPPRTT